MNRRKILAVLTELSAKQWRAIWKQVKKTCPELTEEEFADWITDWMLMLSGRNLAKKMK